MKDVKKGIVPKEIEKKFGRNISIGLLDKSKEEFKKPPPPYVPFSGASVSLGGSSVGAVATSAVDTSNNTHKPIVDPTKPVTVVSIRLHNGTQIKLDLNTDHKVGDIAKYIESVAPVSGSYKLVAGFPPKPLDDFSLTVDAAKLCKSAITQKL